MKFEELRGNNQNEVSLGRSPTIKATLVLNLCRQEELALNKEKLCAHLERLDFWTIYCYNLSSTNFEICQLIDQ